MKLKKVLLVETMSVRHGPPQEIAGVDCDVTKRYSDDLDKRIHNYLKLVGSSNSWNAVKTKYVTNYGLLMLSAELKKYDICVEYVNGDYYSSFDSFLDDVIRRTEDVCGVVFTATTPQYDDVKKCAEILQGLRYKCTLFFGGPHAYFYENNYENNPFDYIIVGHDIVKTAKFIQDNLEKKNDQSIISYFEGYEVTKKDFSIIPSERLRETLLYSYVTYGCPNNCKYCIEHKFNKKMTCANMEEIIDEINYLATECGVRSIHLADSDFFINPVIADRVIEAIKQSGIRACFTVNTSPRTLCNNITQILVERFSKYGLIELLVGVEYFSDDILKRMGKNYSIDTFYKSMKVIRKVAPDVLISFYSLVGFPGENCNTIADNISTFKKFREEKLFDYSFPKIFVPYPGTHIFENSHEYEAKILHHRWKEYHRWSLPRPIEIKNLDEEIILNELLALYDIIIN